MMATLQFDSAIKINYAGSGNNSQFTYDSFGRMTKIVEFANSTINSTKQFVWCLDPMRSYPACEARDANGTVTAKYFLRGQTIGGAIYFYTRDHLASIRDMTDSSGNIQTRYFYDPYGRVTSTVGALASDFQYAGYYYHPPSGSNITLHRLYSPVLGRWLNRDPIGEAGGVNLYAYANDNPLSFVDQSGLAASGIHFSLPPGANDPPDPNPPPETPRDKWLKCRQDCQATRDSNYALAEKYAHPLKRKKAFDEANAIYDDCVKRCGPEPKKPCEGADTGPPPEGSSAPPGGGGGPRKDKKPDDP